MITCIPTKTKMVQSLEEQLLTALKEEEENEDLLKEAIIFYKHPKEYFRK